MNLLLPTQDALATAPTRPSKRLNGSGADNRLSALMTGHANHLPIKGSRVVYVALNLPEHDRDNFSSKILMLYRLVWIENGHPLTNDLLL